MSIDMVMGLAFFAGAFRAVDVALEVLVVIGGIVLKGGNEGTRERASESQRGLIFLATAAKLDDAAAVAF